MFPKKEAKQTHPATCECENKEEDFENMIVFYKKNNIEQEERETIEGIKKGYKATAKKRETGIIKSTSYSAGIGQLTMER